MEVCHASRFIVVVRRRRLLPVDRGCLPLAAVAENPFADSRIVDRDNQRPQNRRTLAVKTTAAAGSRRRRASAFRPGAGASSTVFTPPFVEPQRHQPDAPGVRLLRRLFGPDDAQPNAARTPIQPSDTGDCCTAPAKPFSSTSITIRRSARTSISTATDETQKPPQLLRLRPSADGTDRKRIACSNARFSSCADRCKACSSGGARLSSGRNRRECGSPARYMDTAQFYGGLQR